MFGDGEGFLHLQRRRGIGRRVEFDDDLWLHVEENIFHDPLFLPFFHFRARTSINRSTKSTTRVSGRERKRKKGRERQTRDGLGRVLSSVDLTVVEDFDLLHHPAVVLGALDGPELLLALGTDALSHLLPPLLLLVASSLLGVRKK